MDDVLTRPAANHYEEVVLSLLNLLLTEVVIYKEYNNQTLFIQRKVGKGTDKSVNRLLSEHHTTPSLCRSIYAYYPLFI